MYCNCQFPIFLQAPSLSDGWATCRIPQWAHHHTAWTTMMMKNDAKTVMMTTTTTTKTAILTLLLHLLRTTATIVITTVEAGALEGAGNGSRFWKKKRRRVTRTTTHLKKVTCQGNASLPPLHRRHLLRLNLLQPQQQRAIQCSLASKRPRPQKLLVLATREL